MEIYEVESGQHFHSVFVWKIEFWKKWEDQSKGQLALWYYDSNGKEKNDLIGKSFADRGQQKPRALTIRGEQGWVICPPDVLSILLCWWTSREQITKLLLFSGFCLESQWDIVAETGEERRVRWSICSPSSLSGGLWVPDPVLLPWGWQPSFTTALSSQPRSWPGVLPILANFGVFHCSLLVSFIPVLLFKSSLHESILNFPPLTVSPFSHGDSTWKVVVQRKFSQYLNRANEKLMQLFLKHLC